MLHSTITWRSHIFLYSTVLLLSLDHTHCHVTVTLHTYIMPFSTVICFTYIVPYSTYSCYSYTVAYSIVECHTYIVPHSTVTSYNYTVPYSTVTWCTYMCCTLLSHAILTLCFNLLSHAVLTLCHMLLSNAVLTLCRTRLIYFFGINNIIILFAHKETHKLTWISPNQRDKKQIYHLLISGKWRKSYKMYVLEDGRMLAAITTLLLNTSNWSLKEL